MYINFDLYTLTLNNTTFIIMYPAKMSRNFFKIEMWGCRFPWGVGWFITSEQLRHLGDNRDQEDAFRPGSGPDVRCLIEERLLVRVVYLQYLLARRQQLICIYIQLDTIVFSSILEPEYRFRSHVPEWRLFAERTAWVSITFPRSPPVVGTRTSLSCSAAVQNLKLLQIWVKTFANVRMEVLVTKLKYAIYADNIRLIRVSTYKVRTK